jgi:glutamate N-acetyltransferase/amino-acid N-acetyltransferase
LLDGTTITVTGIAKVGHPPEHGNMLGYIATDAAVTQPLLMKSPARGGELFNRITVDGDTSTNDAFMLISTGSAGNQLLLTLQQRSTCCVMQ